MAKKIKGGSVEVTVTDKGSLKKLGRDAKRTGKDIGSVAKSTAESDRRLKSLSGQTSGSSKAFSKQAQTISGGLVPIYATLAAQVFAVSAAFRFLQESSDFKNLIAGQEAYGAFTGTMYKKLANDIRSATNAQISYSEASQAAAIGIASGLNADQLTALGEAASNVSLILGRDVTDSFNRLIRGVTKAEPELLDELGIILRLDPALKKYASSLGKTKEQLNAFERSQAVAAEVIGQAEEKFGGVAAIMDPSAFAFNQFAQAFNDLMDDLKVGLGGIAQTVLPFFTKNVGALIGALGLFAIPIVKQLLPNFQALEAQSKSTITSISGDIKTLNRETKTLDIAAQVAGGGAGAAQLKKDAKKGLKGLGIKGDLNQRQIAAFRTSAEKKLGIAKNMNKKELQQFKMHLRNLEIAEKASLDKRQRANTATELAKRKQMKETQLFHARMQRMMTKATQVGAKAMNTAFRAMGFIGIGLMLMDFGRMAIEQFVGVDEEAEKLSEKINDIGEAGKASSDALGKMIQLRKDGLVSLSQQASQTAAAIQSIGVAGTLADINFLIEQGGVERSGGHSRISRKTGKTERIGATSEFAANETGKALEQKISAVKKLRDITASPQAVEAYNQYLKEVMSEGGVREETIQAVIKHSNAIVALDQKAKALTRTQDKATESLGGFLGKFAPSTASGQAIVAFDANIGALRARMSALQTEMDAMPATFAPSEALLQAQEEMQTLRDRETANEKIAEILKTTRDEEERIALATERNKTLKASIVQNGTVIAAQATLALNLSNKQLQIDKQIAHINTATKILNDKTIPLDDERRKNAQLSLDIAQEKQLTLEAELEMMGRLVFMDKARGDLALRRKTGGAGMFGLQGKPTTEQIALTMDDMDMTEEEAIAHLQNFNMEMKIANMELDTMEKIGTSVGSALTDGLANAFVEVAKGTTTFADAFRQMTIKVLADIAAMTMKMAIFKMIAGLIGGSSVPMGVKGSEIGSFGPDFGIEIQKGGPNPFAVRSGGIASAQGYRSYARGGVAMGPDSGYAATLHGTEAVVPLGNSRSIPVELKGAGGGVNNITVNVNGGTEGGGQTPEQGKALGQMIQVATMEIIQREKRPGGVLSR